MMSVASIFETKTYVLTILKYVSDITVKYVAKKANTLAKTLFSYDQHPFFVTLKFQNLCRYCNVSPINFVRNVFLIAFPSNT